MPGIFHEPEFTLFTTDRHFNIYLDESSSDFLVVFLSRPF